MSNKRIFKSASVVCLIVMLMATLIFTGCSSKTPESGAEGTENTAQQTPEYPTKPIQIIVPFSPGGTSDIGARMLATFASEKLGQAVQVVNKPGAGGAIGQNEAMTAAPDGYTLVLESPMFAAMPNVITDTEIYFDTRTPIGTAIADPVFIVVPTDSKSKTVNELITEIKNDPANFKWAATGSTGVATFVMGQLMHENGIDVNVTRMVSFQGSAPSVTAAAGKQVDATVGMTSDIQAMVDAGKIRALAVLSEERHPKYPDVPTMAEAGYPEFPKAFTVYYNGLSCPPETPDYIIEKWAEVLKAATEDPEFQKQAKDAGKSVVYWSPEEMKQHMMENQELFKEMAKILNIQAK